VTVASPARATALTACLVSLLAMTGGARAGWSSYVGGVQDQPGASVCVLATESAGTHLMLDQFADDSLVRLRLSRDGWRPAGRSLLTIRFDDDPPGRVSTALVREGFIETGEPRENVRVMIGRAGGAGHTLQVQITDADASFRPVVWSFPLDGLAEAAADWERCAPTLDVAAQRGETASPIQPQTDPNTPPLYAGLARLAGPTAPRRDEAAAGSDWNEPWIAPARDVLAGVALLTALAALAWGVLHLRAVWRHQPPRVRPQEARRTQRLRPSETIVCCGMALLCLALLFPPWLGAPQQAEGGHPAQDLGYGFLFAPPDSEAFCADVAVARLALELMLAVVGTALAWFVQSRREPCPTARR